MAINDSLPDLTSNPIFRPDTINIKMRPKVDTAKTKTTKPAVRSVFDGYMNAFLRQAGIINKNNPNDPSAGARNLQNVIAKNCDSPKVEGQSHMPDGVCDEARKALGFLKTSTAK